MPSSGKPARARSPTASRILWRTNSSAIAQAFRIDDAVVADGDGVLERGAEREAGLPELLDVAHEAEGAGAGNLAAEALGREVERPALAADQRGSKSISTSRRKPRSYGTSSAKAAPCATRTGFRTLMVAAAAPQDHDADLVDRVDERGGAAVHDRHFGAVDLDEDVVDAEAAQGRHQVLDRRDGAAHAVADDGAERGGDDGAVMGVDDALAAAGETGAEEDDAVIGFGWVEGDLDRLAGMDADPLEGHAVAQRGLEPDFMRVFHKPPRRHDG